MELEGGVGCGRGTPCQMVGGRSGQTSRGVPAVRARVSPNGQAQGLKVGRRTRGQGVLMLGRG